MNILIIGATSGIGRALFEKYVSEGNHLGIVGRRTNLLDELQIQHPYNTFVFAADITKQDEIEQAIHTLCEKLGNIDIAIVCSGIGELNPSLYGKFGKHLGNIMSMDCTFCTRFSQ